MPERSVQNPSIKTTETLALTFKHWHHQEIYTNTIAPTIESFQIYKKQKITKYHKSRLIFLLFGVYSNTPTCCGYGTTSFNFIKDGTKEGRLFYYILDGIDCSLFN